MYLLNKSNPNFFLDFPSQNVITSTSATLLPYVCRTFASFNRIIVRRWRKASLSFCPHLEKTATFEPWSSLSSTLSFIRSNVISMKYQAHNVGTFIVNGVGHLATEIERWNACWEIARGSGGSTWLELRKGSSPCHVPSLNLCKTLWNYSCWRGCKKLLLLFW